MADPASIMARIREHSANVILDGGKLKIVNGRKLPAGALDFIKQNGRQIADWLDAEAQFEECAAIIEFDGGTPRDWAEQFAKILFVRKPDGVDEMDWSWFVTTCGRMVDEAPARRSA